MPVNTDLMKNLRDEYGAKRGTSIYYAMENKGNPSTKPAAVKKAQDKRRLHARVLKRKK